MKTSIKRITEFAQHAQAYLASIKEETKLKYAIKKIVARIRLVLDDYNEMRQDKIVDYANTDENGSLLYKMQDGNKVYDCTPLQDKAMRKDLRKLYEEDLFEVESYIVTEGLEKLTLEQKEAFNGFVLILEEQLEGE